MFAFQLSSLFTVRLNVHCICITNLFWISNFQLELHLPLSYLHIVHFHYVQFHFLIFHFHSLAPLLFAQAHLPSCNSIFVSFNILSSFVANLYLHFYYASSKERPLRRLVHQSCRSEFLPLNKCLKVSSECKKVCKLYRFVSEFRRLLSSETTLRSFQRQKESLCATIRAERLFFLWLRTRTRWQVPRKVNL